MIKLLTKIDEMKKDTGLNKMNLKLVKKAPVKKLSF